MPTRVQLIGDEVFYDGHLVAILAQDKVPLGVLRSFEQEFQDESLFDGLACPECGGEREYAHLHDCKLYEPPKGCDDKKQPADYDAALDDVQRAAKEYARGGLLKLTDLATICKQLAEEE